MIALVFFVAMPALALLAVTHAPSHGRAGEEVGPVFEVGLLADFPAAPTQFVTAMAFGPDGRLYVALIDSKFHGSGGQIYALTLDDTGTSIVSSEVIAADTFTVLGLAFDPTRLPTPIIVYASGREGSGALCCDGIVATFTAPGWIREDIITGLPKDLSDHGTNDIDFDSNGRLFIAQGESGVDAPLSGAILVADLRAPDFDGHMTYTDPRGIRPWDFDIASGDVRVYAPGFNNPYGIVVHSNGNVYAMENNPPGLDFVREGEFYGEPNQNRARSDPRQHPDSETDGVPPIFRAVAGGCDDLCEGLAEYRSEAFDGRLRGDLVSVGYYSGAVWRLRLNGDGQAPVRVSGLGTVGNSVAVAVGPSGIIYGNRSYLKPAGLAALTPTVTPRRTPTSTMTFAPTSTPTLPPTPVPTGDANCDGRTDALDAAVVLQKVVHLVIQVPCPAWADLNGDGPIDALDALLILQCSARLRAC